MRRRREPEPAPMLDIWARFERQARAQAEAEAHERKMERRRHPNSAWNEGRQILVEIARLIEHRHQGPCDTDDGEIYLRAAIPWLISKAQNAHGDGMLGVIRGWAHRLTPMVAETTIMALVAEAEERSVRKRLWWRPQELGNLLHLTVTERDRLRITRFRPHGMKQCQFRAYQKAKKAERERARRLTNGARPHEQSAEQLAPWTALGISRRTYYRQKSRGELPSQLRDRGTNSWQPSTEYLQFASGQCQIVRQTVQGPARKDRAKFSASADGPSPSAKPRAVVAGRARALPLPADGVSEHPDLLGGGEWKQLGASLSDYEGGVLPDELVRAIRDAQRVRQMTQEILAHQIGISRPQLANALQRRFGLSRSAATNLKEWLAA